MDMSRQPGVLFNTIFLVQETFSREKHISQKLTSNIGFESRIFEQSDGLFGNELTTSFTLISMEGKEQAKLSCTHVALFEVDKDNPNMDIKTFMNHNSISIMIPYVRQHISNITNMAGIQGIFIPPVNINALKDQNSEV